MSFQFAGFLLLLLLLLLLSQPCPWSIPPYHRASLTTTTFAWSADLQDGLMPCSSLPPTIWPHAVTIKTLPGEPVWSIAVRGCLALLFPSTGIDHALRIMESCAIIGKTDLEKAARAEALFTICKAEDGEKRSRNEM
jgi:hypothetical protein